MKDRVVLAVLIVLAVLSAAAFARTVDWGGWDGHRYSALNLGDGIVAVFDKQAGRVRACSLVAGMQSKDAEPFCFRWTPALDGGR